MIVRRLVVSLAAVGMLALAWAPAAAADPAKPTNYRSRVERVTPATNAIDVKVVGGDGFLELEVQRGHTAAVEGYEGEPWLRVLADGRVQENQSSTATYLNVSRYGSTATVTIPASANKTNARKHPIWKTVDTNGRYVWHDHRIHYMTPQIAPRFVPGTNRVAIGIRPDGRWVVPMTVDGTPTEVIGSLVLFPAPSPVLPWLVVVLVALGVALASWSLHERGALGGGRRGARRRGVRAALGLARAGGGARAGGRQPDLRGPPGVRGATCRWSRSACGEAPRGPSRSSRARPR